jgi:hypothetical protein
MKRCNKCKGWKKLGNFHKNKRTKDGLNDYCKPCKSTYLKRNKYKRSIKAKECLICQKVKPAKDYTTCKTRTDGLQNKCKDCCHVVMRQRAQKNGVLGFLKTKFKQSERSRVRGSRTLEFTITIDDVIALYEKQKGLCAYSGVKMTYSSYKIKCHTRRTWRMTYPYNASIDRIDSLKGYIKGNIQLVCGIVNIMKSDSSEDEFLQLCKKITEHKRL